jgi:hypothetical protein
MRTLITAGGILLLASTAWAAVSANVFRADEQTPLPWADPNVPDIYQHIMVGTRLTIFIVSDEPGGWAGELWHSWEDAAIGSVSGRDGDPNTRNCEGSLLPLTHQKKGASVYSSETESGPVLSLRCTAETLAGEWFVVDYHAKSLGTCYLGFYTSGTMIDPSDPGVFIPPSLERPVGPHVILQALALNHVASRDFSQDTVVNFVDFALLAHAWRSDAPDPNQFEPAPPIDPNTVLSPDLNANDTVDVADLALFSTYWLERTDVNQPPADPNALDPLEDPPGQ